MIMRSFQDSDTNAEIIIFVNDKLIAVDGASLKSIFKYFYFSRFDVLANSEKWDSFASFHLTKNLREQIEKFTKLLVFM